MTDGHWMMPGSHERAYGPECHCGADWDRWNDCCVADADAGATEPADTQETTP